MKHYHYFIGELHNGVDIGQWDAVERRVLRNTSQYQVRFIVNSYVMRVKQMLEQQSYIKFVRA